MVEVLLAGSFGLDCKPIDKLFIKIDNKGPKIDSCEMSACTFLSMMRTDHLKLLFVGDFSKSLLKDVAACLLSCFVLFYI